MTGLVINVTGIPAPQGSKRGFLNKHTGRVVMVEANKATRPWRDRVTAEAETARYHANHETFIGPVAIEMHFHFPHPKSHYRTGKYAHILRDNAPDYVAVKPDLDKLVRATFDALSDARVWRDDSQVAELTTDKAYTEPDELPGVSIYVSAIAPPVVARPPETPATQGSLL